VFKKGSISTIYLPKLQLGSELRFTEPLADTERELEKFFPIEESKYLSEFKEEDAEWDQFEENKVRYNIIANFDPTQYTTELKLEGLSKEQLEKGEAIALEIEGAVSDNYHVGNDRGQVNEDVDEEKAYSAVIGTGAYKHNTQEKGKKDSRKKNKRDKNRKEETKAAVPKFTNFKLETQKIKKLIEADLGISIDTSDKPLNTKAEMYIPKSSRSACSFPIKPIDKDFLIDFRTLFKQSYAKGIASGLMNDSWLTSPEIFIKETKLPPNLFN
jgi:PAB1-binding protein PBP1